MHRDSPEYLLRKACFEVTKVQGFSEIKAQILKNRREIPSIRSQDEAFKASYLQGKNDGLDDAINLIEQYAKRFLNTEISANPEA